jgi:5-methylthioadenosine/S-adenosylhomocysteine deaminase
MTEYLITNGLVVTMDPERRVITEGAVAVEGDTIISVGKSRDLSKEYGSFEVIDARKGVIMPGLVNAHSHLFAMFSRGLGADGHGKRTTRSNYSWDIDRLSLYDKEACRISADLAAIEMIRSGITTTQDSHYINFHLDAIDGVAEAVRDSGIRAVIGRGCWDAPGMAPPEMTEDVWGAIRESDKFIKNWNMKADGRIHTRVEASMLAQCTDDLMKATKSLSEKRGVGWATHLQYRLATSKVDPRLGNNKLDSYKGRAVDYMDSLGILGSDSLLIHCTHVDEKEIEILARTETPVAHCPLANAYGGTSRVTMVPEMNASGVIVGLGTDSVATNDSLDLFQVMKFDSLLHKVNSGNTSAMTAEKVLEMATVESAKALRMEGDVGSLETGKNADIIVLPRDKSGMVPTLNPVKNIVYSTGNNRPVDTVMINGKIVFMDGEVTTLDEALICDRVEEKSRAIMDQLGRLDEYETLNTSPWKFS